VRFLNLGILLLKSKQVLKLLMILNLIAPSFLTKKSLGFATFFGGGKNLHSSTMYSPSEIRGDEGSLFSIPSTN